MIIVMFKLFLLVAAVATVNASHYITKVNETVHYDVVSVSDKPWNPEMYAKKIILKNMTGSITPQTFSLLTELEELYFAHSSIDNIHQEAFRATPKLKILQFSYNVRLPFLSNEILKNCRNLKKLIIGHNRFVDGIADNLLNDLRNLTYVEITRESKMPRKLTKEFFKNDKSLEIMKIHFSNVSVIQSETFHGLNNLKLLSLAENEIVEIEPRAFSSKSLAELYLGWNKLQSFTGDEMFELKNLTRLVISYNPLKKVNLENIKKNAPNLKALSLEKSSLSCSEKESLIKQTNWPFQINIDQMEVEKCEA